MKRRDFMMAVGGVAISPAMVARGGERSHPNVVLILTDDQGYGELSSSGNPIIKTPHIDRLRKEGVSLEDFHVSSVCAPSRAAIMTGKCNSHAGVWHTLGSREIVNIDEILMPQFFAASGYATQMVGKWHLGDNYPFRPQDRGFEDVFQIGGGSPGQIPDYWDNGIFDMHFWNGKRWAASKGFCTDVQFDSAFRFIKKNKQNPFFCYLATTAPHSPTGAPDEYIEMYKELPKGVRRFYGMVTNIDHNLGRMRKFLKREGLAENTILIFMTDNGSACDKRNEYGESGTFNAGMRGKKGSNYDGGHRVPCIIYWPEGGLDHGRKVERLTAHIDILPTLIDACNLVSPANIDFDGRDLMPLLRDPSGPWSDRVIVTESKVNHRERKFGSSTVMTEEWRLVNKDQLFKIKDDPAQKRDLAGKHPEVSKRLRDAYEEWYRKIPFDKENRIIIGSAHENPSRINCMDLYPKEGSGRGAIVWNQKGVKKGQRFHGFWKLEVDSPGVYQFDLRRWPVESGLLFSDVPHKGKKVVYKKASLKLGDFSESKPVDMNSDRVRFEVELGRGPLDMDATFLTDSGEITSAYFVDVKKLK